ncbi:MAG: hypothetical protein ABL930_08260 [Pseudobdellovibrio sp.]
MVRALALIILCSLSLKARAVSFDSDQVAADSKSFNLNQLKRASPESEDNPNCRIRYTFKNKKVTTSNYNNIKDVAKACANHKTSDLIQSSINKNIFSKFNGTVVLSSADFGRKNEIDLISDSQYEIVLCNLKVKKISGVCGQLILYDSEVQELEGFYGQLDLLKSRAFIKKSKLNIKKHSL